VITQMNKEDITGDLGYRDLPTNEKLEVAKEVERICENIIFYNEKVRTGEKR